MTDELQSQKSFTKKEMYNIARDTRNMEISLFWQRSNYFLVLNTAIAIGFFSLKSSDYDLILGLFGCLVSILWVCINLGSKFWQSRWEQRLSLLERELGENINLFSADRKTVEDDVRESFAFSKYRWIDKILNRLILAKPSVSRIMIWLSIIFVLLWFMLVIFTISNKQ